MVQIVATGFGAGLASALLFAALGSGSVLAAFLCYLAPLPVLIAALGFTTLGGAVAVVTAALVLGLWFDLTFATVYLVVTGAPSWWLAYLVLLARPVTDADGATQFEWYPIGRIVLWSAVLGAVAIAAALPRLGAETGSIEGDMRAIFGRLLPAGSPDRDRLLEVMVAVIPPAAAVVSSLTALVNLWIAGRVVTVSERLKRPWPDLTAIELPAYTPLLLAAAAGASFMPGAIGIAGSMLTATFLLAFALVGLAVIHRLTLALNARRFILGALYAAVIVFGWPLVLLSVLGLVDAGLNLRGRNAARGGPPAV